MTTELKPQDLAVGKVYRAKKPARAGGILHTFVNDRQIVWVSADFAYVQYDSPALPLGRHYPRVTTEAFLKWASHKVALRKQDDWVSWAAYEAERAKEKAESKRIAKPKAPPDAPKGQVGTNWPWGD